MIVTDYPKEIKSFYMRLNDDDKTVRAMDVLAPGIGEIIGGSQREERGDVLRHRMRETGLKEEEYYWYLDLRRYGTVPHAGFGLGFERTVQFITGVSNIRDVIPFPRTPRTQSSREGKWRHLATAAPSSRHCLRTALPLSLQSRTSIRSTGTPNPLPL